MTFPFTSYAQPSLPTSTVVPVSDDLFIPYFNRTYEAIATTVNKKVGSYFQIPITSTATNIPNLPNFGAYLLCISGSNTTLPCLVVALAKADATASGVVVPLTSQVGTVSWAGFALTVSATATNFQVAHNNTGATGNFNIQIIGTQG